MYLKVMQDVQQPYCFQTLCLSETCAHRATILQVVRAITKMCSHILPAWNSFSFLFFFLLKSVMEHENL